MHKITNLPDLIPKSVGASISSNAPTRGSNHETCEDWLNVYGSPVFRKYFFKALLCSLIPVPTH